MCAGGGNHVAAAEIVGGEGAAVPAPAAAGRTEAQLPRAGTLAHFRVEVEAQLTQMINQNVHLNSEQLRLQSEQARPPPGGATCDKGVISESD